FLSPSRPPPPTLFPYTTLFRSRLGRELPEAAHALGAVEKPPGRPEPQRRVVPGKRRELARDRRLVEHEQDDGEVALVAEAVEQRSEEHTSELQSRGHLVCRLLL